MPVPKKTKSAVPAFFVHRTEAEAYAKTFWEGEVEVVPYDPSLNCDSKCARAGYCLGGHCDDRWQVKANRQNTALAADGNARGGYPIDSRE